MSCGSLLLSMLTVEWIGRRVLGWEPRSAEDAVVATAESLVQLGLVKSSKKK